MEIKIKPGGFSVYVELIPFVDEFFSISLSVTVHLLCSTTETLTPRCFPCIFCFVLTSPPVFHDLREFILTPSLFISIVFSIFCLFQAWLLVFDYFSCSILRKLFKRNSWMTEDLDLISLFVLSVWGTGGHLRYQITLFIYTWLTDISNFSQIPQKFETLREINDFWLPDRVEQILF